jgi:hypothetical protein
VIWAFSGEECERGVWYGQGDRICFVYEDDPAPECWLYHRTRDGSLQATYTGDDADPSLVVVEESQDPLFCPGPDVGA